MSWGHLIDDRPDEGVFRVHRDAFRDPAVFAQEMVQFFERGWVFVGHASQIPHPHDYITVRVGRNPVIISRDDQGDIHALHNSCRHKGAVVCQHNQGNRRAHLCPYHGWSYASDGRNLLIKDKAEGDYAPSFDTDNHDLQAVARFAQYRGFMFASLSGDVPPLEEHLGDVRSLIDLAVDQAPDGLELVPGVVHYRFQANWKLQLENTVDMYHVPFSHESTVSASGKQFGRRPGETAGSAISDRGNAARLSDEFHALLTSLNYAAKRTHHSRGKGRNTTRAFSPLSFHSFRHFLTSQLHRSAVAPAIVPARTPSTKANSLAPPLKFKA